MYTPGEFENQDLATLHDMMRRHPFALLATVHAGELFLTHLPFHLDAARGPNGTLQAHLARANPHCAALKAGAPSTVVFKGPDAYVSPRWYKDPAKNVPTWNYVAIHAHGRPHTTEDPATLLAMISRLTDEHEAYIDKPWSVKEAQGYAERLVTQILGFELPMARLEGKYKLSQNRSDADRVGVLKAFRKSSDSAVQEMLALMHGLYTDEGKRRGA